MARHSVFQGGKKPWRTSGQDGSIGGHVASSHNHIIIISKIYNNHHSELSEVMLNRSLTTMELKKPHSSILVGGAQAQNGLVPHPRVLDKNLGGISREQGVTALYQPPQPRVPVPGR